MKLTRAQLAENFTVRLEQERIRLGLTQDQMAAKLELSSSGYKKIIAGETCRIDLYVGYLAHEVTGKLICELCNNDDFDISLLQKVRRLSDHQQRHLESLIDEQLRSNQRNCEEQS